MRVYLPRSVRAVLLPARRCVRPRSAFTALRGMFPPRRERRAGALPLQVALLMALLGLLAAPPRALAQDSGNTMPSAGTAQAWGNYYSRLQSG